MLELDEVIDFRIDFDFEMDIFFCHLLPLLFSFLLPPGAAGAADIFLTHRHRTYLMNFYFFLEDFRVLTGGRSLPKISLEDFG